MRLQLQLPPEGLQVTPIGESSLKKLAAIVSHPEDKPVTEAVKEPPRETVLGDKVSDGVPVQVAEVGVGVGVVCPDRHNFFWSSHISSQSSQQNSSFWHTLILQSFSDKTRPVMLTSTEERRNVNINAMANTDRYSTLLGTPRITIIMYCRLIYYS